MKKTLIYLHNKEEADSFKNYAKSKGLSMSAMIRLLFTQKIREENAKPKKK